MDHINIQLRVAPLDCYACGTETKMIASIGLSSGDTNIDCSITDFTDYPELAKQVAESLQGKADIGAIKPRLSRMMGHSYVSNGCAHCDALLGEHYEIHSRYDEAVTGEFTGDKNSEWRIIFDALLASEDGHLL